MPAELNSEVRQKMVDTILYNTANINDSIKNNRYASRCFNSSIL